MDASFRKSEVLWMQNNPEANEKWVQEIVAHDPSILGLGKLVLKGNERRIARSGRLDLLLEDVETSTRYEVELQLGATDPSHIVRAIEYWDLEKRRYPQYSHVAVIVAEEITSRYFNVISLFNQAIPIIAIKVTCLQVENLKTLVFTTVLDIPSLRLDDSDEDITPVDRSYWETNSTPAILGIADKLLEAAKEIQPKTAFKFNKAYIGLTVNGRVTNYFYLTPQKKALRIGFHLERSPELEKKIEAAGFDLAYEAAYKNYVIRLTPQDANDKLGLIKFLLFQAYRETIGEPPNVPKDGNFPEGKSI